MSKDKLPKINLQTPLRYLKGVGPERSKLLARLGLETIEDMFYFFPRRYENRFPIKSISQISAEDKECVRGKVLSRGVIRTRHRQTIFKAVISDGRKYLFAMWFNMPYLSNVIAVKSDIMLYGKFEKKGANFQTVHPEYEILFNMPSAVIESIHAGRIVPVYSLTEDLYQKSIRSLVYQLTRKCSHLLEDYLDQDVLLKRQLMALPLAFQEIHFPRNLEMQEKAYRRLVFDEFAKMQLLVGMKKRQQQRLNKDISHQSGEAQVSGLIESFGFKLTNGQLTAIQDILKDMKKDLPMHRLVQGDVGSGKTVVAAAGLAFTVANGFQGALMAPTEVLAQQHFVTLHRYLEPLGVKCVYLSGGLSVTERQNSIDAIKRGDVQVVVGTHSLIQEGVCFKNLGLAIIDEQHKFGIFQRASLKDKAQKPPHFLLLTATPIPRTLAMTLYGDLDISSISELPPGRMPVRTLWVGESGRRKVYEILDSFVKKGSQGYVICPLIDSNVMKAGQGLNFSVKNAGQAHEELKSVFKDYRVGLLHGRMKGLQKKKIMQDFKEKKLDLLVSTVVIEVGVDVPNANFMIIENAEKFGLAQLHQLRGRVGRGQEESYCILFSDTTNEETQERLQAFTQTQSGFEIAEKDLSIRGAGDVLGKRQHGMADLRIGDLAGDISILKEAKEEAERILDKDPILKAAKNNRLRQVLMSRFGEIEGKKLVVVA